jgi:hypothetical protein
LRIKVRRRHTMAIQASEAQAGKLYRPTRGARGGEYLTLPGFNTKDLVRRLRRKGNSLRGREAHLLAIALRDPAQRVFYRFLRGVDTTTGRKYEKRFVILLPPDHRLREIKAKPGYTNGLKRGGGSG